jgi:hypothetical protein
MDEVDMLNSWLGQLSDGCGENKRWTTPYWRNLSFDTTGVTIQDENDKPFKGKSDKDILEDLGDRFIDISNECLAYGSLSDYFDDDKRKEDLNLGVRVANSIVKKFTGTTDDEWDLYTQEDFDRMDKAQADLDAMVENCNKGIMDLYTKLAELTGDEPPTKLEDCLMSVSDFEKEMKRLGEEYD